MKKALILALTVLTVLCMATAALAIEVSHEGLVEVKWGGYIQGDDKPQPGFEIGDFEAKLTVDFLKDYGDGVTAGVKTKIQAHGDLDPLTKHPTNDDGDLIREFAFDGAGWIQVDRDLFTLKAATKINDQVGRDFKEYKISNLPGLKLNLKLIDGLTAYTIVNAGGNANNGRYNYLAKAEFVEDLFTVGGGIQADAVKDKSGFGVYGTANVIDGLTIDAEFGSRNTDTADENNKAITAIMAGAGYKEGAIDAKASFLMQDSGFKSLCDDDADQGWRINEAYRFLTGDPLEDYNHDVMIVFAKASYKITDDFEVNGNFDYLLSVKDADGKDLPEATEDALTKISYKAGAAYTIDALKLEGWYKAYVGNEVGAKATYTLADGVDTSLKVGFGKKDKDDKNEEAKLSYTALIKAKL